jgi:hypothetical protein
MGNRKGSGNNLGAWREIGMLAIYFSKNEKRGSNFLAWRLSAFFLAQYDTRIILVAIVAV